MKLKLESKLITKIGKGFYYINNDDEFTIDKLVSYYSSGYRGVLGGYSLLN